MSYFDMRDDELPVDPRLARVTETEEKSRNARAEFVQAVRAAHANGASTRVIADACGLSHQRIHQIIHGL